MTPAADRPLRPQRHLHPHTAISPWNDDLDRGRPLTFDQPTQATILPCGTPTGLR